MTRLSCGAFAFHRIAQPLSVTRISVQKRQRGPVSLANRAHISFMSSLGSASATNPNYKAETNRPSRVEIAAETLKAIRNGSYSTGEESFALGPSVDACSSNTQYESANSAQLSGWRDTFIGRPHADLTRTTRVETRQASTLVALRRMREVTSQNTHIGVLNFASAKKPGGEFLSGARAQEETLARSSTLYSSLTSPTGQTFYTPEEGRKEAGYYSHALIWSPGVTFFRSDEGDWLPPCIVDVITCAAVNAGAVRGKLTDDTQRLAADTQIHETMLERMRRLLRAFEIHGSTHLILGSFGTGAFKNAVSLVATLGRFSWSWSAVSRLVSAHRVCHHR